LLFAKLPSLRIIKAATAGIAAITGGSERNHTEVTWTRATIKSRKGARQSERFRKGEKFILDNCITI
jgi:hypothetical protein